MLRETQLWLGGLLTAAFGGALLVLLAESGAGADYFGAYLGAALAVGFGGFFVYVARDERRARAPLLGAPDDAAAETRGERGTP